jgi:hypothetical protein
VTADAGKPQPSDDAPDRPGVLFTWPNALLVLTLIAGCAVLVSHNTNGLPRYIQVIQALGHCIWLMPFALFYNVEGTRLARRLYIAANLLFLALVYLFSA